MLGLGVVPWKTWCLGYINDFGESDGFLIGLFFFLFSTIDCS